jgi:pimeloyl-ACP methyl ester carboxylesterase
LNFEQTFDLLQDKSSSSSNIVFVFVHGGAGSRAMFRKHAEILVEKYHHTCILVDLPGHGSLVDTPLTLDSCVDVVSTLVGCHPDKPAPTELQQLWMQPKTVIYVGGSLGAYTGFHILDKLTPHHKVDGAILLDCGQNVGPGASLKARLGLVLMNYIGKHTSNVKMMSMMQGIVSKSKADFYLHETSYSSGMFFQQAPAQVECLKQVAPAQLIPLLDIPILFMNGSEDYRDSENKWLDLCTDKTGSSIKVY